MTPIAVFARAFGIGLVVAVPVGAMAMRCIERTLSNGRALGYATGAGIATADAVYAGVAAFGLTALSSVLIGAESWILLIGGAVLAYLGARTAVSRPFGDEAAAVPRKRSAYASAVLLTLANPQTILMFVGIFAGAGLAVREGGWWQPATAVAGVFAGSLAWWIVLVTSVAIVRERVGGRMLAWTTRVSGMAIALFGLVTLVAGGRALLGLS